MSLRFLNGGAGRRWHNASGLDQLNPQSRLWDRLPHPDEGKKRGPASISHRARLSTGKRKPAITLAKLNLPD